MTESDDFSPEDVFKIFPTAFPLRPKVERLPEPEPESTTTIVNATVATTLEPGLEFFFGINGTWIFGEAEDTIILPLLLGLLGLCSVIGNGLVMFVILAIRRMRSGANFMLLNITVSDMVFMVFCAPTAIINHATPGGMFSLPGVEVCKFVHYMLFVTVYVSIYSLVVACVFRFFGDHMTGQKHQGPGSNNPLLSRGNALISSLVIWTAFILSHLNFLVQQEGAVFQEPFICLHSYVLPEPTKIKTLWVTFLTCAFLVPLVTICSLSAVVLHRQRRNRAMAALRAAQKHYRNSNSQQHRTHSRSHSPHQAHHLPQNPHHSQQYEMAQNEINEQRHSREFTMVVMASMVTKAICWLPIQIFVMVDIFGMTEITEVYKKAEMLGVCCAFAGTCITPVLYNYLSLDFKCAFNDTFRKMGCTCVSDKAEEEAQSEMNETIMSIISDSSNHINYN